MKYNKILVKVSNATEKLAALLYLEKIFGAMVEDCTLQKSLRGEFDSLFKYVKYNIGGYIDGSGGLRQEDSLIFQFSELNKITKTILEEENAKFEVLKLGDKVKSQTGHYLYTIICVASKPNFYTIVSQDYYTQSGWGCASLEELTNRIKMYGFQKVEN